MATRAPLVQSLDDSEPLQLGALGQLLGAASPESQDRNESLAFAGGLLGPGSGNSMSGALGNAIGAQMAQRNKQQELQAQYIPFVLQAMGLQQEHQNLMSAYLGRGPGMPADGGAGPASGPIGGAGTPGLGGISSAGAGAVPMGAPASHLGSLSFDQAAMIDAVRPNDHFLDKWKLAHTGMEMKPNTFYQGVDGRTNYVPDLKTGVTLDGSGQMVPITGAAESLGAIAGATTGAQKKAEAPYTMMKIVAPDGRGGTMEQTITLEQLLQRLQKEGWQRPAPQAVPASTGAMTATPGGMQVSADDQRAHDADAIANLQDMIASSTTPPDQRAGLQRELARLQATQAPAPHGQWVGSKADVLAQIAAMKDKSAQPAALADYQRFLADQGRPAATAAPVGAPSMIASGPGVQTAPSTTQAAEAEAAKIRAADPAQAAATFNKGRAEDMVKYGSSLNSKVEQGAEMNMRLQEQLAALDKFRAGGGGETRAQLAQMAQAIPGMPAAVVNGIAGGNLASMQEFNKLAAQTAMEQLKASMGGAGRISQYEFKVFQNNNPNLSTDPDAIRKIFNFNTRLYQRDLAEQKALAQHVASGGNPADFPAAWQQQLAKQGYTNPDMKAQQAPAAGWSAAPKPTGTVGGWSVVPR